MQRISLAVWQCLTVSQPSFVLVLSSHPSPIASWFQSQVTLQCLRDVPTIVIVNCNPTVLRQLTDLFSSRTNRWHKVLNILFPFTHTTHSHSHFTLHYDDVSCYLLCNRDKMTIGLLTITRWMDAGWKWSWGEPPTKAAGIQTDSLRHSVLCWCCPASAGAGITHQKVRQV